MRTATIDNNLELVRREILLDIVAICCDSER